MAHGSTRFLLTALFATLVVGVTARAAEPATLTPRQKGDLAIEARAILRKHCHDCHGGKNTRTAWSILDHTSLTDAKRLVPFVNVRTPAASLMIHFIEDGSMPQGRRPRPSAEEITKVKAWIAAGAPSYPITFDEEYTLNAIRTDLLTQGEKAVSFRYFSFAHLLSDESKAPTSLAQPLADLEKVIDDLGGPAAKAALSPVDSTGTVFRLDVSKFGWNDAQLFRTAMPGTTSGIHPFTPYDLLLLEYPYGSTALAKGFDEYFARTKLARPIPFLRGDWVSKALLPGSPLAEDLKSLTKLHAELEKQSFPTLKDEKNTPCGSASRSFGWRNPVPPAEKPDSQSPILPLSAWYSGDVNPLQPPFDLKVELVNEDKQPMTAVHTGQKFQLKVTTKPTVRYTLLSVLTDGTIRVQTTNLGGQFQQDESYLKPNQNTSFYIDGILTGEAKGMEYFVLLASETDQPLPPVTVFRSRHANWDSGNCTAEKRFPVWRFQFDMSKAPQGFDPAKVVRRVIPIPIEAKKAD